MSENETTTTTNTGIIVPDGYYLHSNGTALIHKTAYIDSNVFIDSYAHIGYNTRIDSNTRIGSNTRIDDNVTIGSNAHIGSNVFIDVWQYISGIEGDISSEFFGNSSGDKFRIGCTIKSYSWWMEYGLELAAEHNMSGAEIEFWRDKIEEWNKTQ